MMVQKYFITVSTDRLKLLCLVKNEYEINEWMKTSLKEILLNEKSTSAKHTEVNA